MSKLWRYRKAVYVGAGLAGVVTTYYVYDSRTKAALLASAEQPKLAERLPTRQQQLDSLDQEAFDVLIIGGGATGAGCVLDAQTRGLKTALVEKFDFSSGTSSRSTKLLHGGVRYLQKAVFGLDRDQYRMVKEALAERANLLEIAPHLAWPLPIMLPLYKWWQLPYYWAGIKCYDLVAGKRNLHSSYYMSKKAALASFPMLKHEALIGALVYYDGQQEDARMNLSIVMTAARAGATVCNYAEVVKLLRSPNKDGVEEVCGAVVRDRMTGKEHIVKAKCVINATGPYTDQIRLMSGGAGETKPICQPSSGTHIVLPEYYSPTKMGLLDPATSDGRVIFFLPWQNSTIAGTTDNKCTLTDNPSPTEAEIEFILNEIKNYLNQDVQVRRGDVLSAWTGIRPLVMDPSKSDTQSLARNHIIEVSKDKLITIAGGKWTTYRHMAEETIDKAVKVCNLPATSGCRTKGLLIDGAHNWTPTMHIRLVQDFGFDVKVAEHLANTYGDRAFKVAKLAGLTGLRWPVVGQRLHPDYPYIEAEVIWACQREYACRALDVIARRTRLAFLNVHAAEEALPKIVNIMARELKWSPEKKKEELEYCRVFLQKEMGLDLRQRLVGSAPQLSTEEENRYRKTFKNIDQDNKGYITTSDLRRHLKNLGERIPDEKLSEILNEVNISRNGRVDLGEYLQLMSSLKHGTVSNSRFAMAAEMKQSKIPTERSGGGV